MIYGFIDLQKYSFNDFCFSGGFDFPVGVYIY